MRKNYKKILKSELEVSDKINMGVQGAFDMLGIEDVTPRSQKKLSMLYAKYAAAILAVCLIVPGGVVFAAYVSGENSDFYQALFGNLVRGSVEEKVAYDEDGKMSVNRPNSERVDIDEEQAENLLGEYLTGESGTYELVSYFGEVTTLSIENLLYDTETGCYSLYLSLERESGDFSDITVFEDGECYFNGSGFIMGIIYPGNTYYDNVNSTDKKIYITIVGVGGFIDNEPMVLEFGEYVDSKLVDSEDIGDEDKSEDGTVYDEVYFDLGKINLPQIEESLPCSTIQIDGKPAIIMSSVGMRLYYDPLCLGPEIDDLIYYSAIEFTDGTRYVIEDDANNTKSSDYVLIVGANDNNGISDTFIAYCFNRLIDPNNVSKVIINDTEYNAE